MPRTTCRAWRRTARSRSSGSTRRDRWRRRARPARSRATRRRCRRRTAPPSTNWWLPHAWSVPVPLGCSVRPNSDCVKVVTLSGRPISSRGDVERRHRLRELLQQDCVVAVLRAVGVEAADRAEEHLAARAHLRAELDQPCRLRSAGCRAPVPGRRRDRRRGCRWPPACRPAAGRRRTPGWRPARTGGRRRSASIACTACRRASAAGGGEKFMPDRPRLAPGGITLLRTSPRSAGRVAGDDTEPRQASR